MRHFIKGIGILGALIAVEALIRLSNLAGAFGGGDAGIYFGMTLVAVIVGGFLLLSFARDFVPWMKWTAFVPVVLSMALLMFAPAFPVVEQALVGFALTLAGLFALKPMTVSPKEEEAAE